LVVGIQIQNLNSICLSPFQFLSLFLPLPYSFLLFSPSLFSTPLSRSSRGPAWLASQPAIVVRPPAAQPAQPRASSRPAQLTLSAQLAHTAAASPFPSPSLAPLRLTAGPACHPLRPAVSQPDSAESHAVARVRSRHAPVLGSHAKEAHLHAI
jgi:hypothetical protein